MQAFIIFYPGRKFFMQAIKNKIVYPSTFCSLCKPLACINYTWKKNKYTRIKNIYYSISFKKIIKVEVYCILKYIEILIIIF